MENLISIATDTVAKIHGMHPQDVNNITTKAMRLHLHLFKDRGYVIATYAEVIEAGLFTDNVDESCMANPTKYAWGLLLPTPVSKPTIAIYIICEAAYLPNTIQCFITPDLKAKFEAMFEQTIATARRMEDNGNDDDAARFRGIVDGMAFVLDGLGLKLNHMTETFTAEEVKS